MTTKSGGGGARGGGDWTITPDEDAPSWIGAPPGDVVSGVAGGTGAKPGKTKVIEAVTAPSVDLGGTEPKIQIDPTLGLGQAPVSGSIGTIKNGGGVGIGALAAHGDDTPLPLPNAPLSPTPAPVPQSPMPLQAPPMVSAPMVPVGPSIQAMSMMQQPPPMMPTPYPGAMVAAPMAYAPSASGSTPRLPSNSDVANQGFYPTMDQTAHVGRSPKRGRLALVLIVALLALGAAGAAVYLMVLRKSPAKIAPAPAPTQPIATAPVPQPVAPPVPPTPPPPIGSAGSGSAAAVAPDAGSGSGSGSATEDTALPPGPGECVVDVVTSPTEAAIFDDHNLRLGTSPAQVKVPCGQTRLILRKDTYAETMRAVTATTGATAKLRAALVHASLSVKVSSTPAGATVSVGGKSKGVTPTTMQLPMLEASTIVFMKDGFATESEKIVPRQANQAVHVQLKRKGRR
jgi:hypothetical protein